MGWRENPGSRQDPALKTPRGEGCRSLALFWGLLLCSGLSPFSFCLLSSLSVETGSSGAEPVRAAFAELGAVRGTRSPIS